MNAKSINFFFKKCYLVMAEQLSGQRYDYQEPMSLKKLQYYPIGRHSD